MGKTKRVQVLMEPEEFEILAELARKRCTSVSDLIRGAARTKLLDPMNEARRAQAAELFLSLPQAPLSDWTDLKNEIQDRRG